TRAWKAAGTRTLESVRYVAQPFQAAGWRSFPAPQRAPASGGSWRTFQHAPRPITRKNSVRQKVKNDVDSQRIGSLLGKLVKEVIVLSFALPAVAVVAVMDCNDHDPALVIQDRPDV